MRRAPAVLILATLATAVAGLATLAGCPSDPTFVLADASDAGDASDTGTTTAPDAADGAGCGVTCGPAMTCTDGQCRCPTGGCDETILAGGVTRVALALGFGPAPVIAFERAAPDHDVSAATWSTCCGWAPTYGVWQASAVLDIGLDSGGHARILGLGAEGTAVVLREEDGRWTKRDTRAAPCHFGSMQRSPSTGALVLGCVHDDGDLELWDEDRFGDSFDIRATPGLPVGAPPSPGPVRWTLDALGRAHVAFTTAAASDGRQVVLADETQADWRVLPIDLAPTPGDGVVRLAPAVDRGGDVHVLVVHADDGGDRLVEHVRRSDVWSEGDLASGPALGHAILAVAGGAGDALQVLYDVGDHLHWWSYQGALDKTAAHAERESVGGFRAGALVVREGHAFVAYVTAEGALHLWRPTEELTP